MAGPDGWSKGWKGRSRPDRSNRRYPPNGAAHHHGPGSGRAQANPAADVRTSTARVMHSTTFSRRRTGFLRSFRIIVWLHGFAQCNVPTRRPRVLGPLASRPRVHGSHPGRCTPHPPPTEAGSPLPSAADVRGVSGGIRGASGRFNPRKRPHPPPQDLRPAPVAKGSPAGFESR